MRILFGVLCLANLVVFLWAERLPEPESQEVPAANLPRVEPIQIIETKKGIAKPQENP